jgi:hypothetical protein
LSTILRFWQIFGKFWTNHGGKSYVRPDGLAKSRAVHHESVGKVMVNFGKFLLVATYLSKK